MVVEASFTLVQNPLPTVTINQLGGNPICFGDTLCLEAVAANAVAYVSSFEAGDATGAVTEAGIFNASTSGTMLCRTKFNVVNKAADDTMTVTWTITLSAT